MILYYPVSSNIIYLRIVIGLACLWFVTWSMTIGSGALVDVEPFGGYNMSGTCSKAGGRDYLGLFLQMKSVSERELP